MTYENEPEAQSDNTPNSGGDQPPAFVSSGVSPPLTADGTPLASGNVYELKEDLTEPRKPRGKKVPKLLASKGDRFLYIEEMGHVAVSNLIRLTGYRPVCTMWPTGKQVPPIVSKLVIAKHDSRSLLAKTRWSLDEREFDAEEILLQLLHEGRVTIETLEATARLVGDHQQALDDNEEFDDARKLQTLADDAAKDAHENNFESRRGVYRIQDANLVCIYDNTPWASAPSLRDEMLTAFKADLAEHTLSLAAESSYPKNGPQAHYTRVLLIRDVFGNSDRVREVFQKHVSAAGDAIRSTPTLVEEGPIA